jgi:hypothetical protein
VNESLVIASHDQILDRIRGEYLEMPGLRLTPAQAQRLWGLETHVCLQLLESLTTARFLVRKDNGTYGRVTDGALAVPPLQMARVRVPRRAADRRSPIRAVAG